MDTALDKAVFSSFPLHYLYAIEHAYGYLKFGITMPPNSLLFRSDLMMIFDNIQVQYIENFSVCYKSRYCALVKGSYV